MPNPKTKRTVVLQSSFNASSVSTFNLVMDASFTTTASTANKFDDNSADNSEDKAKYKMAFSIAGGGPIGNLTLRLVGKGDPGLAGVTVVKTARSDTSPAPTTGNVALIDTPAHSFERIWKQATMNSANAEVVDSIAKLDMRVDAGAGYTVNQAVSAQSDGHLVIAYSWLDGNGAPVITGTVTLDSAVTVSRGYHLGIIRVTDNDPTTGEERHR